MSAAESEAAVDALAAKRREMGINDFSRYAFVALGILGWNAPEVLTFVLDRADEQIEASA